LWVFGRCGATFGETFDGTSQLVTRLDRIRAFPGFPSIGWDIAITPIGPVLIEGNYNWDVVLAQQAGSRPLGGTAFPDRFLSWLAAAGTRELKG
jgi:hypothetical protein